MQTTVRRKQSKSCPAVVHISARILLKAADVMAPEAEAAETKRKPAAQSLGHRLKGRCRIAAPMDGELLSTGSSRTREDNRLLFPAFIPQQIEDGLVIKISIVIVHLEWI